MNAPAIMQRVIVQEGCFAVNLREIHTRESSAYLVSAQVRLDYQPLQSCLFVFSKRRSPLQGQVPSSRCQTARLQLPLYLDNLNNDCRHQRDISRQPEY